MLSNDLKKILDTGKLTEAFMFLADAIEEIQNQLNNLENN